MTFRSLRSRYAFVFGSTPFAVSLFWGVFVLGIGLSSVLFSKSHFLPPADVLMPSPDLILDHLPAMSSFGIALWGPLIITVVLICNLAVMPWYTPVTLKAIGLVYFLRAFFIILTPFGMRDEQYLKVATTFLESITYENDFFFSGHVAFPFLLALIFWRHPLLRNAYLAMTVMIGTAVLVEHLHYSVDVFSAPFFVLVAWGACKKYLRWDVEFAAKAEQRFS